MLAELIRRWQFKAAELERYGAPEAAAAFVTCAHELKKWEAEQAVESSGDRGTPDGQSVSKP